MRFYGSFSKCVGFVVIALFLVGVKGLIVRLLVLEDSLSFQDGFHLVVIKLILVKDCLCFRFVVFPISAFIAQHCVNIFAISIGLFQLELVKFKIMGRLGVSN